MSLKSLLEEFTPDRSRVNVQPASPKSYDKNDIEALRKSAFEDGYASGWEDARKAEEAAKIRIDAEFERCIQNLAFTYHEAVGQVRSELVPLIEALLESFFSTLVPELLREAVREEILKFAEDHLAPSIELQASEGMVEMFEELLTGQTDLEISLRVEPSLGPGQAFVKIEHREVFVDFEPLLEVARSQLAALNETKSREAANG